MTDANSPSDPAASPPPGYPGAPTPPPQPQQPAYEPAPYGSTPDQSAVQGAYYAQPSYPQQQQPYGYGYGYAPAPKTNALAIVSLVASIANFVVLPFIAAVVAVITGHMALRQLKTNGEAGRGMALAGTIIGWVGVGLGILIGVLFVLWILFVVNVASTSGYDYYTS